MTTYYDNDYWNLSPRERLQRARDRYHKWKRIIERDRERLTGSQVVKVVIAGGSRYVDVWGNVTETKPVEYSMGQPTKVVQRQYLADYKRYMEAMLEYERLRSELEKQDTHVQPTTAPRKPPVETPRGPIGSAKIREEKVSEHEIIDRIKKEVRDRLRRSAEQAKRLKSDEAIADLLDDAADAQKLAMDDDAKVALGVAQGVAEVNLTESMAKAESKKTPRALKNLLNDTATAQLLGADNQTAEALQVAGDVAEEIEENAEKWFRKKPTKQRFRYWLRWQAAAQMMGRKDNKNWLEGVKRRLAPGKYETKAGDTLSKIAKAYYGDPSRWDIIYIHNYGSIGNDPDKILPKITIEIP